MNANEIAALVLFSSCGSYALGYGLGVFQDHGDDAIRFFSRWPIPACLFMAGILCLIPSK